MNYFEFVQGFFCCHFVLFLTLVLKPRQNSYRILLITSRLTVNLAASRMGYGLMQEYYYLILATCWQCRPVKMFTEFIVYELQTNSIKAFHNKILRPSYLVNGELEIWKKKKAFCYNSVLITCHDKVVQNNTAGFFSHVRTTEGLESSSAVCLK